MRKEKTIGELINDYEFSSCYNIYYFLLKSKYMRYVFEDNFKELLKHINKYETETASKRKKFKEKKLISIKNHNYLRRFIKYFHNYAAAVYSVEGHYNKFLPKERNVWEKFKTIKQKPLHLFIIALRDNITHCTIPPISISINYKKRMTSQGEVLFLTKGRFKVSKAAFLSDYQNAQRNATKRNILCAYISRKYKGSLPIDLKDVVKKHHKMFLEHINKIDSELIEMNKAECYKTERLYKEIIKRQGLL